MPPTSSRTTTPNDSSSRCAIRAAWWPNSAQRKPCTTPVIGLTPIHCRHAMGKTSHEYAIGVAKSHACTRNGTVYWTSRYFTFSAESQIVTATAVATMNRIQNGSVSTCHGGTMRYHAINPTRTTDPTAKSTRPASTGATGMRTRGTYTFVTSAWFSTMLFVEDVSAFANTNHGSSAE